MRFVLGLLLAAAPMSAMAAVPVTATVLNPSFEAPITGSYVYNPTGASWTFTGGSGIAHNGSAFSFPNAPDGTQVAFLQNGASISQSITLAIGATYDVTFYGIIRPGNPVNPITVTFGSFNLGTFTPTSNSSYTLFTTPTFVATSTSQLLSFTTAANAGDIDSGIDLVTVIQTAAAPVTPIAEPMSMALLGAGLLGVGLVRRRSV